MTGKLSRVRRSTIAWTVLAAAALVAIIFSAIALADDGSIPVPEGEAERLGGGVEQQAALADGNVSQTEYSDAFQRTLDCLDEAGIPYVVSQDLQGKPQYSAGPFASKGESDAAKPIIDGCYFEHMRGIDVADAAAGR